MKTYMTPEEHARLHRRRGRQALGLLIAVLVGAVLLFPHAILHEAGLTFLGFGLEPHLPATGVLLSESMRYVSAGWWWLGVLPGLCLLAMVLTFEQVALGLRLMLDPRRAQE